MYNQEIFQILNRMTALVQTGEPCLFEALKESSGKSFNGGDNSVYYLVRKVIEEKGWSQSVLMLFSSRVTQEEKLEVLESAKEKVTG